MERLVLVHGSVVNGRATWSAQRPLAERFELVVLDRPGFPPNPPAERVDFESDAAARRGAAPSWRSPRRTLVRRRHRMLAAAQRPGALGSLTVIEPPATRVAKDNPDVDAFAAGGAALYDVGRDERPGGISSALPRGRGLPLRPSHPAPARPRTGRAGAHRRARAVGGGDPARRARRRRPSRSSSSPGRTTPPSTRSATSSSASSEQSERCSRATATSSSCTRSSTRCSPTSSSARAEARR